MKTKRRTMVLLALPCLLFAQAAQAFYNPSTGRWLNRKGVAPYYVAPYY